MQKHTSVFMNRISVWPSIKLIESYVRKAELCLDGEGRTMREYLSKLFFYHIPQTGNIQYPSVLLSIILSHPVSP